MDEEGFLPTVEDVAGKFDITRGLSMEEHRERLSAPELFDKVVRLREALRALYDYTIALEARLSPWVATRPGMVDYPDTSENREALGKRVRELLDPETA